MKKPLGPLNALYPSLTTLVGALVDGKPNFLAVAHVGILNHGTPQYLSFGVNKAHHTCRGILEQRAFGVSIPHEGLMDRTDYVGLVSGRSTDKSGVFEVFYGELGNAPLAAECPVCMELRLHEVPDYRTHHVFVGEVAATWAEEDALSGGRIDFAKVRPLLFDMPLRKYRALGPVLGDCWQEGKALKQTGEK